MTAQEKSKPQKTFTWWDTRRGHYNWANPSEESTSYQFHLRNDAPKFGCLSWEFADDRDPNVRSGEDPDECARQLLEVVKTYLYSSTRKDLEALVSYLESVAERDWADRCRYEVDLAEWQVQEAQKRAAEWREKLSRAENAVDEADLRKCAKEADNAAR